MMLPAIVCVDDDWNVLRSLGAQLKRNFGREYDVELSCSGEDALSLCAELVNEGRQIPLIISDQKMLGIKGDELLVQLHHLYPLTLKIMLTGQADADEVGKAVNAGALYRYIRKPWDETDLMLTVAQALDSFQKDQQLLEQFQQLQTVNAKLEKSLALLLATLESTADGLLVLDMGGDIVSFNQKFVQLWGLNDMPTTAATEVLKEEIKLSLTGTDAQSFQSLIEHVNQEQQGSWTLGNGCIIEYYLQPYKLEGAAVGGVLSCRDVTQEQQAAAAMKHQVLHDALTGLPNRTLFNQLLSDALEDANQQSTCLAVMFLDLDRFKAVNDTLGHAIGDCLLKIVVQRLVGCLRTIDVIARWGGDEFVLLQPRISGRKDSSEIANRLIEVLQSDICIQGHYIDVTVSVGIALYPNDGSDSSTLLQCADVALYRVKNSGRNNYQYYSTGVGVSEV